MYCGPLCEYVCKSMLFISLCRCVVVLYVSMLVGICYLFLFADLLWSFYVSMFVSICYLFLFADVLWSFLCEYVCKYMLFIFLADVFWYFYVSMFVSISVFSFSLQMCCGPFMGVCL